MNKQRGSTLLGFIIGVVVGLAVALLVALYVTKTPVPFMNKGQNRTPEQDAAEQERNKDWKPNAPLATKTRPAPAPAEPETPAPVTAPAKSTDPLGDLARAKISEDNKAANPNTLAYFIQVGAYYKPEDAEAQRARLSLSGVQARVLRAEDASGRQIYRVRVGPYERKEDADRAESQLKAAGQQTAQVRGQR
ncbi:sporulation protein [Hylemonella gracilis str. Niagara R]|uniref:Sporulation protein n=1 Tax=Hylemonella gracilis str. Niagara R TaxID=1458275 RepID=A0A016XFZ2_9BURK|nr:SPOR domain-containing protein [Hylemonella gracilis]EYC50103.1 sporulation protein [Hylemonella gracilis str. Niagara R]